MRLSGLLTSAQLLPRNSSLRGQRKTIERNADVLLNARKKSALIVNAGKTKYMEVGRHMDLMVNEHITVSSNSYEQVKTFKYIGLLMKN